MKKLQDGIQKTLSLLILSAALLAAFAPPANAQETTPVITDDQVNQIAKQMFCPVCENVPLDVCPTQACHQWRETIRLLLSEGKSEQEIKDYFVQQYGDRVLAAPPARGFNWLVYVVPPVAVVTGGIALFFAMRNWQRPVKDEEIVPPTIEDDEYIRRLEEELKRRG